jgi:2-methylcitrate dehydratase PrpD
MNQCLIEELGSFFAKLSFEQLPQKVTEKAKACLLNSLAAAIGGYNIDLSKRASKLIKRIDKGDGISTILINGAKVSSLSASFANCVMSCSRAQNDTHFESVAHIGEVVPYVCLALGEEKRVSGKDFLTAFVTGYEVMAGLEREGSFHDSSRFRSTPV